MPAGDPTPSASRPAGAGSCALLGATTALAALVLPDAVLLPALDHTQPRVLGMLAFGLLMAGGWALGVRLARRAVVLVAGAVALAGGFLAGTLVPHLNPWLDGFLTSTGAGAYYPSIFACCVLVALPLGAPLGTLAAAALGGTRRRPVVAFLAGAGAGFVTGPFLGEALLGRPAMLQACGLLAATAAVLLAEAGARPAERRLTAGATPALLALGVVLGGGWRLLSCTVELGTLGVPWLLAFTCLAGALGAALARGRWMALAAGALAAAVPLLFPQAPRVSRPGAHLPGDDLAALATVGIPAGLVLGALLALPGRGPRAAALALLLPCAAATVALAAPHLGPGACGLAAAALVAAWHLRTRRLPSRGALAAGLGVLALLALPVAGSGRGLLPHRTWELSQGTLSLVDDEATGRTLLAVDGRAPLGRSLLQDRRLVHLPLLVHGGPLERVLVVASDRGEAAAAALEHDWVDPMDPAHRPPFVWWLSPLPYPSDLDTGPEPPNLFRQSATERQFLRAQAEPYDVIVLTPDLRADRRAALVGTMPWFEQVADRLRPDGLLCQWFDLSALDITDLKRVLASAHRVFVHVWVLLDHPRSRRPCLGLVCARRPLSLSPAALDLRLHRLPSVAADLEAVGLSGLQLACLFTADRGTLQLLAPGEDALDDLRPTLGARGGVRTLAHPATLLAGLTAFSERRHGPMQWIDVPETRRNAVRAHLRDMYRGWQHLFAGTERVIRAGAGAGTPFELEAPGAGPEEEADGFIEALAPLPDWPYLHQQVKGFAARLEAEGRSQEAERYLYRAVERAPASPGLRFALAGVVQRRGDHQQAAELYGTVLAFDPRHEGARAALAALRGPTADPADG